MQVDAAGDGLSTFAYVNFDTFVTNIGTDSDFYTDYKVELITSTPHMTVWGAQTESDDTPPTIPPKPTVAGGSGQISISWTSYSEPSDILEYEIYRNKTGVFTALNGDTCTGALDATCQVNQGTVTGKITTDTNVDNGAIYFYVVTAVDKSHNGDVISRISPVSDGITTSGGAGGGGASTPSTASTTKPSTTTGNVTVSSSLGGSTSVTASGGGGAAVDFPSSAVSSDATVTIASISKTDSVVSTAVSAAPSGKQVVGSNVYDYAAVVGTSSVTTFASDVILTFTYTDAQVSGLNANSLKVYYWDTATEAWVALSSVVDSVTKTVTATTNHFTYFALFADTAEGVSLVDTAGTALADGNLISTADSFDIYIASFVGEKRFKRLILNPTIFESYGHLDWGNVMTVSQAVQDAFTLSDLVIEVNADGTVANEKVFKVSSALNSDVGQKQWLNMTSAQFELEGYDWDAIAKINHTEASPNFYPEGVQITSIL